MTTPAVWLHGTGLAGLTWDEGLSGDWPVLPGHGNAPRHTAAVEAYADAIEPTLPESFVIGGHSLGGMVALTLAARAGPHCQALVLVETPLRVNAVLRAGAKALPVILWPRLLAYMVGRDIKDPQTRQSVKKTFAGTPRAGLIDALQAAADFDGHAVLQGLSIPVLSLLGKRSVVTAPSDRVGTSITLPAGHTVPLEKPHDVARHIQDFLAANDLKTSNSALQRP